MRTYYLHNRHKKWEKLLVPDAAADEGAPGLTGSVRRVDNARALKLYHPKVLQRSRAKLAKRIIIQSFSDQYSVLSEYREVPFTWPLGPVFSKQELNDDYFVGFVMPLVRNFVELNKIFPSTSFHGFNTSEYARIAAHIAGAFRTLHEKNILLGDVNFKNIVYSRETNLPHILDCDSMQFSHGNEIFSCDAGVPDFSSPKLIQRVAANNQSWIGVRRTKEDDEFSLSVIIFHLLMKGYSPFIAIGRTNSNENKAAYRFPYMLGSGEKLAKHAPVAEYNGLSRELRENFEGTFARAGSVAALKWEMDLQYLYNKPLTTTGLFTRVLRKLGFSR